MQEALLREFAIKQQIPGITQGIKQVIEYAAIQAIREGSERVTGRLLSAWRDVFEQPMWARPSPTSPPRGREPKAPRRPRPRGTENRWVR
jgi:hypothetical protein